MRAWAVSIGSELLSGQITDTNATFLAQECAAAGIDLIRVTQVGDDKAALVATLRLALTEADVVICTGGIGPTDDDLTRESIAEIAGEKPEPDPKLLADLTSFFANRGQDMPERNAKQAWIIPSSCTLPNPVGTAPGWFVNIPEGAIIAMPGVPREMYRMWREQALPALQALAGATIIRSVTIKTLGIGESAAEDQIHDLVVRPQPVIATYAKDDGVHIRVTATSDSVFDADQHLQSGIQEVEARLRDYIWGTGDETLPGVLVGALAQVSATIAIMELGSGGSFAGMLASVSGDDLTHPLVDARVLPLDRSLDEHSATERAAEFADRMRADAESSLGVAIVLDGMFDQRGVFRGGATVAISSGSKAAQVSRAGLRASIEDAHRRAALHAADQLRHFLKSANLVP